MNDESQNTVYVCDSTVFTNLQQSLSDKNNFYKLQSPHITNFFGIGLQKSKEINIVFYSIISKVYQFYLDSTLKKDINNAILKITADGTKSGLKEIVNSLSYIIEWKLFSEAFYFKSETETFETF